MSGTLSSSGVDSPAVKRKRKSITLEMKLDVLRRYDRGERTADIERLLGLNESTLRSIRDNAAKIRESSKTATTLSAYRVTISRCSIMEQMEKRLVTWLEEQNGNNVYVNNATVKDVAKRMYDELRNSNPDVDAKPFNASSGWFERFKVRHGFYKSKTVDGSSAVEKFQDVFKAVVDENGYSPKQVFNLRETGLYWKRMPGETFLSTDQEAGIGLKPQNDRCMLLLGGNASGDYRIKPLLVYHTETPKVLKGYSKTHLPVVWRSSKKGYITSKVFLDYFGSQLHQEFKTYCENEGLPFKILLLLDMTSAYPPNLADLSSNVRVLFLSTTVPPSIQPMDQGVTTMFKSCYHRQLFAKLIASSEVKGKSSASEFWKSFNLKIAIDVIAEAWAEISGQVMHGAWRQLWPEIVEHSQNYQLGDDISNVRLSMIDMAKAAGFADVNEKVIEDLIESHNVDRDNDDFQHIEEEQSKETEDSGSDNESVRMLSTEVLSEIFQLGDQILSLIDENDPDRERSSRVAKDFQNVLACYKELYREKVKHSSHISVDTFFIKYE
ncbi:hypothetical protein BsWGS_02849 [Bradybaena similaris]